MTQCQTLSDAELARILPRDHAGCGALETARGLLPLTAMHVDAEVVGLVARTELAQTFVNTLSEAIEATYIFPLPDRAAVTRFRMELAGRVVEGVVDERGKARADYEQAIAAGHRAAIAEEDRSGVFTLRVGNLLPGESAIIRLTLVGPLPVDDGEVTFQFPLVVAPRYVPGRSLPGPTAGSGVAQDTDLVPDASRISPPVLLPGFPNPVQLSISLAIDAAGLPVGAPRSSLHAVATRESNGAQRVELRPGERLDRDFIVRWSLGDAEIRSSAVSCADAEGDRSTVLLTLVPPGGQVTQRPKDVVFALDRSGSMDGWKMVAARRATARMVDTLGERDRFSVLAFDNDVEEPGSLATGALSPASDRHRFRGVEFLSTIAARGGTEMREPLVRGLERLGRVEPDRDRVLVLITDGQVGNEDHLLRELAPRIGTTRVFTLGIDRSVNAAFLRRLAALGGGACELVESEDRLDEVLAKIHRRIATPVVTDLAITGEGLSLDAASLAPARLPALFAGAPITAAARVLSRDARGTLVVHGRTPSGMPWRQELRVEPASSDALAAIWARARIRDLEDRHAAHRGDAGVEREIVETSIRHQVLSRFTAYLAVDRSERANEGGDPRQITQAVEMPSGWTDDLDTACMPCAAPMAAPMEAERLLSQAMGPATPMNCFEESSDAESAAPASRPAPKKRGRGFVGRLLGGGERSSAPDREKTAREKSGRAQEGRGEKKSRRAGGPADESVGTPYLARVASIADDLEAALARDDRAAVDLAVARLAELIEDLRSIGGLEALATRLDASLVELRALIGDSRRALADVRASVATLRKITKEPVAIGERREDFWK